MKRKTALVTHAEVAEELMSDTTGFWVEDENVVMKSIAHSLISIAKSLENLAGREGIVVRRKD